MKWFESWFDTNYYHILYNNRDYNEAENFIDNLLEVIKLKENSKVLDLACGKGRHSLYLNKKGFIVNGVDLSKNSIDKASESENERLHFSVHDMRVNCDEKYDAVFNLFTSFGYFEDEGDDQKIICNIKEALKDESSIAVIDYINSEKAILNLKESEIIVKEGIEFKIKRWFDNTTIYKEISFSDKGENFLFTEKVKRFKLGDFNKLFETCDLNLIATFGSYSMDAFDLETSSRLIMILKK